MAKSEPVADYEFDVEKFTDETKILMRDLIAEIKSGAEGVEAAIHAAVDTWFSTRTNEAEITALERRRRDMPSIHATTTIQESMRLSCARHCSRSSTKISISGRAAPAPETDEPAAQIDPTTRAL